MRLIARGGTYNNVAFIVYSVGLYNMCPLVLLLLYIHCS